MASRVSPAELRNMQKEDLLKEITSQRAEVAKLRMAVAMRKEKNSSKYKMEKKQLARMETVLTEKNREELKAEPKAPTVRARKSSSKAS